MLSRTKCFFLMCVNKPKNIPWGLGGNSGCLMDKYLLCSALPMDLPVSDVSVVLDSQQKTFSSLSSLTSSPLYHLFSPLEGKKGELHPRRLGGGRPPGLRSTSLLPTGRPGQGLVRPLGAAPVPHPDGARHHQGGSRAGQQQESRVRNPEEDGEGQTVAPADEHRGTTEKHGRRRCRADAERGWSRGEWTEFIGSFIKTKVAPFETSTCPCCAVEQPHRCVWAEAVGLPHLHGGGLLGQDGWERPAGPALRHQQRESDDRASQELEKCPLKTRMCVCGGVCECGCVTVLM